eukprot:TRINITY_DN28183_c0_g1_i1.p1 TRINITY_DN28183_c0_g1~~TRINITY_DN28183_c0_g1_i1.p1  ORF type:complete len:593 (+),score=124.88 TRINITY_DN28183_c0_g1_i1:91-1869(+)
MASPPAAGGAAERRGDMKAAREAVFEYVGAFGAEVVGGWLREAAAALHGVGPETPAGAGLRQGSPAPSSGGEWGEWKRGHAALFRPVTAPRLALGSGERPQLPPSASPEATPGGVRRCLALTPPPPATAGGGRAQGPGDAHSCGSGAPSPLPRVPPGGAARARPPAEGCRAQQSPGAERRPRHSRAGAQCAACGSLQGSPRSRTSPAPRNASQPTADEEAAERALLELLPQLQHSDWQKRQRALCDLRQLLCAEAAAPLLRRCGELLGRAVGALATQLADPRAGVAKPALYAATELAVRLRSDLPLRHMRTLLSPALAAVELDAAACHTAACGCAQQLLRARPVCPPPVDLLLPAAAGEGRRSTGRGKDAAAALLVEVLTRCVARMCDVILLVPDADGEGPLEAAVPLGAAHDQPRAHFARLRGLSTDAVQVYPVRQGEPLGADYAALCDRREWLLQLAHEAARAQRPAQQSFWALYMLFPVQCEALWEAVGPAARQQLLAAIPAEPAFVCPFTVPDGRPPRESGGGRCGSASQPRAAQRAGRTSSSARGSWSPGGGDTAALRAEGSAPRPRTAVAPRRPRRSGTGSMGGLG